MAFPTYDAASVFFTALGVFAVWAAWGKGRLGVAYITDRLSGVGLSANSLLVIEFLLVLALGVLLAVAFVQPQTPQQAIAGGMGWTGLVARPAATPPEEQA